MSDENAALEATETPSGEAGGHEGDAPQDGDGLDAVVVPGADGEGEEGEEGSAAGPVEESEAWKALEKKYPNLHGRALREQVANKMWESMNFASRTARESEELRDMLREQQEPDEPETQLPNPQIEALDQRIKGLYAKDQTVQKTQNDTLIKLSEADKNIAKIEARLEDAQDRVKDPNLEEYAKGRAESAIGTFEARLEAAQAKRQSILDRYGSLGDKRETYGHEMEKLLTDKDWLSKVADKQVTDAKSAKESDRRFNVEFPDYVDSLIESAADRLEAPAEARLRRSLGIAVNRAMMVEFMNVGDTDLDDIDVPGMVDGYVQEYLSDRDLVSRERFERKSAAKRKVTGKGTTSAPVPAAKRPPVPPSLMSTGDTTPGMLRARKYLNSRNL